MIRFGCEIMNISKQAIIKLKLKMMISVTSKTQMRTNSSFVTLGSLEYFSSAPSVTAVFHVSSTMACCVCMSLCVWTGKV